jgi:hypothetical protein
MLTGMEATRTPRPTQLLTLRCSWRRCPRSCLPCDVHGGDAHAVAYPAMFMEAMPTQLLTLRCSWGRCPRSCLSCDVHGGDAHAEVSPCDAHGGESRVGSIRRLTTFNSLSDDFHREGSVGPRQRLLPNVYVSIPQPPCTERTACLSGTASNQMCGG